MIVRVLIVSICLGFLSCQGNATPPRGIKIAALLKTSTNPFFQLMWEGIKQEADLIGVKVDLFWPESESDFAYQYNFLQSKAFDYDALIIAPSNAEGVRDYLPPLRAAGKWIILTDIDFPLLPAMKQLDYYDAFIGTDDAIGAKLVAEFVKKRFRDLMQVTVVAGFRFHLEKPRFARFIQEIRLAFPQAKIDTYIGNYERAEARAIAKQHLATLRMSEVVYCANDHMALGILDTLHELQVKSLPVIIGYDSIREAQEAIVAGDMAASVVQLPSRMGREAVRGVVLRAQGKPIAPRTLIPPELSVRRVAIDSVPLEQLYGKQPY